MNKFVATAIALSLSAVSLATLAQGPGRQQFDPHTQGARAGEKFDPHSQGAKSGDKFDPYSQGANKSTRADLQATPAEDPNKKQAKKQKSHARKATPAN